MVVDRLVTAQWLKENFNNVKILDASETIKPKPNIDEFESKYFGKFDQLMKDFKEQCYLDEHIPGAAHFNFDVAYHPTTYKKFNLYAPETFQKYIRLLGVKKSDRVIIYSRGPAAGCLFASRAYWTFKVYGHDNVSILNGGLNAWKQAGGDVKSGEESFEEGDFDAKPINYEILARFEKIPFKNIKDVHFVDVRAPAQFSGEEPLKNTFPNTKATGSHIPGSKNLPMGLLFNENGFKPAEELQKVLKDHNVDATTDVILSCNGGVQASAAYVALLECGIQAKVYNGSMSELATRAPELVSENSN